MAQLTKAYFYQWYMPNFTFACQFSNRWWRIFDEF